MKTVAFFNNKGGVGKTTLIYHLAWMMSSKGKSVLVVDLDPQANLSAMFLKEDRLLDIWDGNLSVSSALGPLVEGTGDVATPHVEELSDRLRLVVGDMTLSRFEDQLSENWPKCLGGDPRAFRVLTAFHRLICKVVDEFPADIVFIDVGPNLGAINRAALIAADHVVTPMAPDLFSLQGLKNLGPTLVDWRSGWKERRKKSPKTIGIPIPEGGMVPVGYVVMQHGVREDRPVKAYTKWLSRIPVEFQKSVLARAKVKAPEIDKDPSNLAILKHYRSLMPLAMEARKPMFSLKPGDGAIGAHMDAVKACRGDFELLSKAILAKIGFGSPQKVAKSKPGEE